MAAFSFGDNWAQYLLRHFSERRLTHARTDLRTWLGKRLHGKVFLDIGCGSGIHSLAAIQLGARVMVSFDADAQCVRCCRELKKRYMIGNAWKIYQGSILNKRFLKKIPRADIVYAWGSLHHTGDIWKALEHSVALLKPKGIFFLALYNKRGGLFGSRFWLMVKKRYNASPEIGKRMLEFAYGIAFFLINFLRFENPVRKIRHYEKERGMAWMTDVRDWLGGYPYAYATKQEIVDFCAKYRLTLWKYREARSLGNNIFLFERTSE